MAKINGSIPQTRLLYVNKKTLPKGGLMKLQTVTALLVVSSMAFATETAPTTATTAPAAATTTEAAKPAPKKMAKKAKKAPEVKKEEVAPTAPTSMNATTVPAVAATTEAVAPAANQTTSAAVTTEANQPKDIDQEITNARMRAELGSKSRWSMSASLAYSGSTIEKPFEEVRPEYRGSEGAPTPVDLSGDIGVKYRLDNGSALSLGTGVAVMTPFHGDYTKSEIVDPTSAEGEKVERFQLSTPSIGWSKGYKAMGLQMSSSLEASVSTLSSSIRAKNYGGISFQQAMIGEVNTNLSTGVYASVYMPIQGDLTEQEESELGRQTLVQFGLTPFMEYSFNDNVSLRTVFGWFYISKSKDARTGEDPAAFRLGTAYQSVGVGYSATRDIYLYPNVQFVPFDIRSDRTNVALSAIVNMF